MTSTRTRVLLTCGALCLCAIGFVFLPHRGVGHTPNALTTGPVDDDRPCTVADVSIMSADYPQTRSSIASVDAAIPPANAEGSPRPGALVVVSGLALGCSGEPVSDASITVLGRAGRSVGSTDRSGMFKATGVTHGDVLGATREGLTTILGHVVQGGRVNTDATIVTARSVDISGWIVDENGTLLSGCALWIVITPQALANIDRPLDRTQFLARWTKSDSSGHFGWNGVPSEPGILIRLSLSGYVEQHVPVPVASVDGITWTLKKDTSKRITLAGIVLSNAGAGVPDATVQASENYKTRTDAYGLFELPLGEIDDDVSLVAFKEDFQPAVIPTLAESLGVEKAGKRWIELHLGPPASSIAGRLVGATPDQGAGWECRILDGTSISSHRMLPDLIEDAIAGRTKVMVTDSAGAFRVSGLIDRSYKLWFLDPRSLAQFETEPIRAGSSGVLIQVPTGLIRQHLHGRLRTAGGLAVPDVHITAWATKTMALGMWTRTGSSVTSAVDGTFDFVGVPRQGLALNIAGDAVMPFYHPVPEDFEGDELVLTVDSRCGLLLEGETEGSDTADMFVVFDARGGQLLVYADAPFNFVQVPLASRATRLFTVGDAARSLTLYRAGVALRTIPLDLSPSAAVTVKY